MLHTAFLSVFTFRSAKTFCSKQPICLIYTPEMFRVDTI